MSCYIAFPDYPAAAMPALPDGWTDVSWRHDTCPCYARASGNVVIWIDYPDVDDREFANTKRFRVVAYDDPDHVDETDDWAEALAIAAAVPPTPPTINLV
jgi:hypothetical protein